MMSGPGVGRLIVICFNNDIITELLEGNRDVLSRGVDRLIQLSTQGNYVSFRQSERHDSPVVGHGKRYMRIPATVVRGKNWSHSRDFTFLVIGVMRWFHYTYA